MSLPADMIERAARGRIVAVICPSCKGTGSSSSLGWSCQWCRGEKKVKTEQALQWADISEMLGRGGYVCGDHDLETMNEMVSEAKAVRALAATGHSQG